MSDWTSVYNLLLSFGRTSFASVAISILLRFSWLGLGIFFRASILLAKALLTTMNPSFFKVVS